MITIRTADTADFPAIAELLDELFSLEQDFVPDREKQFRGLQMLKESDRAVIFVADDNGKAVADCTVQLLYSTAEGAYSALIEDLIIAKEYRGRKLGRRLLEHAEQWARSRGATRMQLNCDDANLPARKFYESHGWQRSHLTDYFRYLK